MRQTPMRLFTPADILIILLLALIGYFAIFLSHKNEFGNPMAFIQIDNVTEYEVDLQKNQIILLNQFSPAVKVEVRNKSIGISKNDCAQRICIRMGFISHVGQMVVCVPKKILIYISGSNEDETIDAITG